MAFTTSLYRLDPERFRREVVRSKSADSQRLEILEFLSEEEFRELGGLFSRFLDLTIIVKDLTHQAWTLHFLMFFPQTRSLHLKCLWSLDSLAPVEGLQELSEIELGSLLNGTASLAPLVCLKKIKLLSVTGQWSDLFYLMKLQHLERLVFSGFSTGEFGFIAELEHLREIEIIDSMIQDLGSLKSGSVSSLRLSNLRNLLNLDWLVAFPKLRHLKLKRLPKVDRLPSQIFLDQLQSFSATHLKNAGIRHTVEKQNREEGLFAL